MSEILGLGVSILVQTIHFSSFHYDYNNTAASSFIGQSSTPPYTIVLRLILFLRPKAARHALSALVRELSARSIDDLERTFLRCCVLLCFIDPELPSS
jgi:hypothetical protein